MKPHFIVINQSLGPFYTDIARALADRGHQTTVIASERLRFEWPGVTFVGGPAYRRDSIGDRLRSWTSFLLFTRKVLKTVSGPATILSSSNPPLLPHTVSLAGHRFKHVARILDLYPDVLSSHPVIGRVPLLAWLWRSANSWSYRKADRVLTIAPQMAESIRAATGVTPTVIPDWSTVDESKVPAKSQNQMRAGLGLSEKLVVLYSGNLGLAHDLSIFVEAAAQLSGEAIHFVVISQGARVEAIRADVSARGVDQLFTFLPLQPIDLLPVSMGMGDLSIVTVAPGAETTLFPCKTYDYMAAGSAVLAVARRPSDLADLVDRRGCGIVVAPGDVQGLVAALRKALADRPWLNRMQSASSSEAANQFSRARCCGEVVALLESVALPGARS